MKYHIFRIDIWGGLSDDDPDPIIPRISVPQWGENPTVFDSKKMALDAVAKSANKDNKYIILKVYG